MRFFEKLRQEKVFGICIETCMKAKHTRAPYNQRHTTFSQVSPKTFKAKTFLVEHKVFILSSCVIVLVVNSVFFGQLCPESFPRSNSRLMSWTGNLILLISVLLSRTFIAGQTLQNQSAANLNSSKGSSLQKRYTSSCLFRADNCADILLSSFVFLAT